MDDEIQKNIKFRGDFEKLQLDEGLERLVTVDKGITKARKPRFLKLFVIY